MNISFIHWQGIFKKEPKLNDATDALSLFIWNFLAQQWYGKWWPQICYNHPIRCVKGDTVYPIQHLNPLKTHRPFISTPTV